jgi:hypothetical protein
MWVDDLHVAQLISSSAWWHGSDVPSELFHMKNKFLYLANNKLCSLPSEISHLATLKELWVRLPLPERSGAIWPQAQCFQVNSNQLTSLPPELGLLTKLDSLDVRLSEQMGHDLTAVSRF